MIITRQKDINEILDLLKNSKRIFLLGCAQCATVCKTGGEEELDQMEAVLTKAGKTVKGKAVLDPVCHLVKVKQFFQQNKKDLSETDAILVMACGDGVQVALEGTKGKKVVPGLSTLFLGELERGGHFSQKCTLCGECIIGSTGGICPVTICSKGLLNGPCGGSNKGKCEIDKERDCGWILIYKRLKDIGELDNMKKLVKPFDYSRQQKPQRVIIK